MNTENVTRLEIIDHRPCKECHGARWIHLNEPDQRPVECSECWGMGSKGRTVIVGGPAYKQPDNADITLSLQDDGKTLKVFVSDKNV